MSGFITYAKENLYWGKTTGKTDGTHEPFLAEGGKIKE